MAFLYAFNTNITVVAVIMVTYFCIAEFSIWIIKTYYCMKKSNYFYIKQGKKRRLSYKDLLEIMMKTFFISSWLMNHQLSTNLIWPLVIALDYILNTTLWCCYPTWVGHNVFYLNKIPSAYCTFWMFYYFHYHFYVLVLIHIFVHL